MAAPPSPAPCSGAKRHRDTIRRIQPTVELLTKSYQIR
jgi:hypothetical protein